MCHIPTPYKLHYTYNIPVSHDFDYISVLQRAPTQLSLNFRWIVTSEKFRFLHNRQVFTLINSPKIFSVYLLDLGKLFLCAHRTLTFFWLEYLLCVRLISECSLSSIIRILGTAASKPKRRLLFDSWRKKDLEIISTDFFDWWRCD